MITSMMGTYIWLLLMQGTYIWLLLSRALTHDYFYAGRLYRRLLLCRAPIYKRTASMVKV